MVKRILSIILLLNLLILSTVFEQNAEAAGVVSDCVNFGTYTTEGTLSYALYLGGEVTFACSGTIPISTHILITENTVINANQNDVVLSGGNTDSVFWVDAGVQLDLIGLKITGGNYTHGGGIRNMGGIVNLSNCEIYGNTGNTGAGINNSNTPTYVGKMTLANTTVSDNIAQGAGGAIGGGIYNAGNMTITDSTVTRNSATTITSSTSGGGIYWSEPIRLHT